MTDLMESNAGASGVAGRLDGAADEELRALIQQATAVLDARESERKRAKTRCHRDNQKASKAARPKRFNRKTSASARQTTHEYGNSLKQGELEMTGFDERLRLALDELSDLVDSLDAQQAERRVLLALPCSVIEIAKFLALMDRDNPCSLDFWRYVQEVKDDNTQQRSANVQMRRYLSYRIAAGLIDGLEQVRAEYGMPERTQN